MVEPGIEVVCLSRVFLDRCCGIPLSKAGDHLKR